MHLDGFEFQIPKKNLNVNFTSAVMKNVNGLDDGSNSILLHFDANEIADKVSGYKPCNGRYPENIAAVFNLLSEDEERLYSAIETFRPLWEGEGSYTGRIVEPYDELSWFKVFRRIEYPRRWTVTSIHPKELENTSSEIHKLRLAECSEVVSPLTKDGRLVRCLTYVIFDGFLVEFSVSEENLVMLDELREYFQSEINSWRSS